MNLTQQITIALKKHLKQKGLTYAQLAAHLDISEASVKRLFSESTFTIKRLEAICQLLDLDFLELARLARGQQELTEELSELQEKNLADNPKLLGVFYLLLSQWQIGEITRQFAIAEPELLQLLMKLDKLKLIELHPHNRIKLLTHTTLQWRENGPIRQKYQAQVMKEFLQTDFHDEQAVLRFETRELSSASIAVLQRKMARLLTEFNELADIDASLAAEQRQGVALLMAARPWVFSLLSDLKRKNR
ncbi:helix-turn-helix transcriptional regulator [Undibacterium sp. TS12]|uniref:helix-turn-helix domain-containing protein n=1 Tax=Undibacterium sp. TS12 TaxID=2908202 RepID=UPI001F4CF30A|nr:helix-turn-helix transcriptional regulator [Undibacterium sp. TS12]MCH8619232.1 helix-turn-helix domain-containing protein [Undibacterium sp. TS12]